MAGLKSRLFSDNLVFFVIKNRLPNFRRKLDPFRSLYYFYSDLRMEMGVSYLIEAGWAVPLRFRQGQSGRVRAGASWSRGRGGGLLAFLSDSPPGRNVREGTYELGFGNGSKVEGRIV